ncbi:MAG: hypothetical protein AB8G96_10010 [Phycisphaerales bacterium]
MPPAPRRIRNLTEERRLAAAAAVRGFLRDLAADLRGVDHRVIDGSAVAAEVQFSEEQLTRAVLRVDVAVADGTQRAAGRALAAAGFAPGPPSGDVALMRIAHRRGRRAVHVLMDGDAAESELAGAGGGADANDRRPALAPRVHPGSPEAAHRRAATLAQAFLPVAGTWIRTDEHAVPPEDSGRDDATRSETREVQLVIDGTRQV